MNAETLLNTPDKKPGTSQPEADSPGAAGFWPGIQARLGFGARPAPDNRFDTFIQLAVAVLIGLVFYLLVAGPALNRYLAANRLDHVPFTGLERPSFESFAAVGLIIVVAVILSRFPWFLYTSFQDTKKARIRGDTWLDMWALGYSTKLRLSGRAEKILNDFEKREKARMGGQAPSVNAAEADPSAVSGDPKAEREGNLRDLKAAFFQRFEDSYGYAPFRGPLWAITMLYLIGWLTLLMPYGLSGRLAPAAALAPLGGLQTLIGRGMTGYVGAVAGGLTTVSAAFLGAYIFSVTSLFRRYLRSDFKPTAITQACLRVVTAWIVGFLLSLAPIDVLSRLPIADVQRQRLLLVLAFFLGIFALNAVFILWELMVKTLPELTHFGNSLRPSELTQLDGLDAWHEDRLNEAGIDSVRGLANVDFLDLLIGVRMPTQTLVDWVDQALLRMHVSEATWKFLQNDTSIRTASDMLHFLGPRKAEEKGNLQGNEKDDEAGHAQVEGNKDKLVRVATALHNKEPEELTGDDIDMLEDVLGREPNIERIITYYRRQGQMARDKVSDIDW